jgi:methanogenic corrinoid protein MtbC1
MSVHGKGSKLSAASAGSHSQPLLQALEASILPDLLDRYLGTHSSAQPAPDTPSQIALSRSTTSAEQDAFVGLLVDESEDAALGKVLELRRQGVPDQTLLLDVLAPASIRLGELWEEDLRSFSEVTIGVCRLHRILRALHPTDQRALDQQAHGGRAALLAAPGEQHAFGMLLVSELMFRAGWYVDVELDTQLDAAGELVQRNWYELVGVSVSGVTCIDAAAKLIKQLRRRSCNRDVVILAGGNLFIDNPSLGADLGADQVVTDSVELARIMSANVPSRQIS